MHVSVDPEEVVPTLPVIIQSPPQDPGDPLVSTLSASSLFANLFVNSGELRTPESPEGKEIQTKPIV